MRTGLEGNPRATREYQPTNRREHKSPAAAASLPARFQWPFTSSEKIEEEILLPVDNSSAISTSRLTDAGPMVSEC